MNVGEARMYLQGEAEQCLHEAETHIKLLSKKDAVNILGKLSRELYQLARNVQREKNIPARIPANILICYDEVVYLGDDVGRKILSSQSAAEKEAVKRKLLADLVKVRAKIHTVESMLVQLEKEGQRDNQRLNA